MYGKYIRLLLLALSIGGLFCTCTRYTNELPLISIPRERLVVPVYSGGINIAEFIFEKIRTPHSDTVFLSIRNNLQVNLSDFQFLIEFCRKTPQSFDNCDRQFTAFFSGTIKADSTYSNVHKWIDKQIDLNAALINAGILSINESSQHPLANSYSSVYSIFETDTTVGARVYYGQARGFILIDGTAIFRLKASGTLNYSAQGFFTQIKDFTGQFSQIGTEAVSLSGFQLDTLVVNGEKTMVDTSQLQKLAFRLRLHRPLNDTIGSVYILLQKPEN